MDAKNGLNGMCLLTSLTSSDFDKKKKLRFNKQISLNIIACD